MRKIYTQAHKIRHKAKEITSNNQSSREKKNVRMKEIK